MPGVRELGMMFVFILTILIQVALIIILLHVLKSNRSADFRMSSSSEFHSFSKTRGVVFAVQLH